MIIAIEGIDACGKATHSKLLADHLGATRFTFPDYSTPVGDLILNWLETGRAVEGIANALAFQCMQVANRLEKLPEIERAVAKGPVVFDRYNTSALVYGTLSGLRSEWIDLINRALPKATYQVLIDVSVDTSFSRRPDRRDYYESNMSFMEKARVAYLRQFTDKPFHYVVPGDGSIAEVQARIRVALGV